MDDFINITKKNLDEQHLCCIIRSKVINPGIENKEEWLKDRLDKGHVFRKLDVKGTVFIEYAPLEEAFVPIIGDNFYYIYCLWITGEYKGKGYGKELLDYCINDAKRNKKSGICMLGSTKQKAWLTSQDFMKKNGFSVVESKFGYDLLCLSFDGKTPKFSNSITNKIDNEELTIYYCNQCPYTYNSINMIKEYCKNINKAVNFIEVNSLQMAKELPCVFNNYAIFYNKKFVDVNVLLDMKKLERIIRQ